MTHETALNITGGSLQILGAVFIALQLIDLRKLRGDESIPQRIAERATRAARRLFRVRRDQTVSPSTINAASEVDMALEITAKRGPVIFANETIEERIERLRVGLNATREDLSNEIDNRQKRLDEVRSDLTRRVDEESATLGGKIGDVSAELHGLKERVTRTTLGWAGFWLIVGGLALTIAAAAS